MKCLVLLPVLQNRLLDIRLFGLSFMERTLTQTPVAHSGYRGFSV